MADKVVMVPVRITKAEIRAKIRRELRSGDREVSQNGWYAAEARGMAVVKPHDDTQAFHADIRFIYGWYYPEPGWWEHLI